MHYRRLLVGVGNCTAESKTYHGSASAARRYLEADRSRVDDYYLSQGTGVAELYVASPTAAVRPAGQLSGAEYEAWVAGYDPATGAPKGHFAAMFRPCDSSR